jgi:hypothetical protein
MAQIIIRIDPVPSRKVPVAGMEQSMISQFVPIGRCPFPVFDPILKSRRSAGNIKCTLHPEGIEQGYGIVEVDIQSVVIGKYHSA